MSRSTSTAEYQALAQFRFLIRRYLNNGEKAARSVGLEPQQYMGLLALRGLPFDEEPTIRALAERLQIQHHSAVELVDRLVDRCFVTRSRAPSDRRQVLIRLTPRGEAELEKLAVCHMEELQKNGPALVAALDTLIRRNDGGN